MTFYLSDEPQPRAANPAPAPNAGTLEVLGAAWDAEGIETDAWGRADRVRREVIGEIEERIGDFGADAPIQPAPDVTGLGLEPQYQGYAENDAARRPYVERQILHRASRFASENPDAYGGLPLDEAALEAEVNRRLRAEWEEDQAVLQVGGFGSGFAEFAGRAARASTDEFGIASMLAGGPVLGKGAAATARFIGFEAAVGGVSEAFVLPRQMDMAERLGIPAPDALDQIALGVLGSAALAGMGAAAWRGISYLGGRAGGEAEVRPDGVDPYDAQADVDAAEAAMREGAPLPAASPAADDFDAVAGRIIGIESGGNASARNPASSASGAGQFIDSTWLAMIRRHRPDLAEGRSNADILALRYDPAISREMTAAYARDNAALLAAEGLPTDPGSLYLAHFAGPGGAARALRADPAAHVSAALSPEQIRANRNVRYGGKFLPDFTVGDLRRWAEVKMGQAVDPGTSWRSSTGAGYTRAGQATTPAGTRIDVEYEIVDASSLLPASGDLQPRDRSRASSDEQIAQIAARLDPARLMPSPETDRGAPLVGPDDVIESGNGRVRAIMRAAELHPDRYDAYRAAIAEVAPIPEGVGTPVLIARRTTPLDDAARVGLVQESNTSSIARMSASEQAGMEASAIVPSDLDLHMPGRSIASQENRAFARALLGRLPQAERAGLVDEAGNLNAAGARRLREALVARAYGAPDLTRILAEDEGGDLRGLVEALGDAAPSWARLRDEIAAGRLSPELDATEQLVEALRIIGRARATARATPGLSVRGALEEALDQVDAFTGPVDRVTRRFVDVYYRPGGPRSQADVAALLEAYVEGAFRVGDVEARLLAETGGASPEEIIDAIIAADPEAFGRARALSRDAGRGPAPERPEPDDREPGPRGGGAGEPPSGGGGSGDGRGQGPFGPVLTEYAGDPARQPRTSHGRTASASSAIPDATGHAEDTPSAPSVQPPDIRIADDAAFGAGSASPEVDATNRSALADLRARIEAEGDFEVATGALVDTPEGKRAETVSARAFLDELDDAEDLAEVIAACTLGGRRDA